MTARHYWAVWSGSAPPLPGSARAWTQGAGGLSAGNRGFGNRTPRVVGRIVGGTVVDRLLTVPATPDEELLAGPLRHGTVTAGEGRLGHVMPHSLRTFFRNNDRIAATRDLLHGHPPRRHCRVVLRTTACGDRNQFLSGPGRLIETHPAGRYEGRECEGVGIKQRTIPAIVADHHAVGDRNRAGDVLATCFWGAAVPSSHRRDSTGPRESWVPRLRSQASQRRSKR